MNVLFVSIDTLRADHLSCYGYDRPTSPEIDELAADGHRFTSAYTVMATTLPAHLAMFTSLFPAQTSVVANGYQVPDGVHTLPERLSAAGFQTGGFVSAIPLDPQVNIDQGFDTYDSPGQIPRDGGDTADLAMRWIEARDRSAPFFCFLHMFDPHTWYQVDEEEFARPFGAPVGRGLPPLRGFLEQRIPPNIRKASVDTYDAEIRYADAQVGRVLRFLDEEGLRDNTIVVLVSDHGESLDELHERRAYAFDHGEFLSRRELRVPLVFWLPSSYEERGPAVHDALVSILDLTPTLLDLLGLECAPPTVGRSLTGLMAGDSLPDLVHVAQRRVLDARDRQYLKGLEVSVIDGRWHWIRSKARKDRLFDLQNDPDETTNVIADHPETVEALDESLKKWMGLVAQPLWEADAEMSPQLREALESLGYFGDEPE